MKENDSTSVTKVENVGGVINRINLFNDKELVAAETFLNKVIKSDKSGIKSVSDGLAVLMKAQDLNLPFSTCLEHMHVINDRTGVDIHIIKALLLRAGCTWECISDYAPIYEMTDGINVYMDNKLPSYAKAFKSQKEALAYKSDDDTVAVYPVKWYCDFNGNYYRDYQLNNQNYTVVTNRQQATEVIKAKKIPVYRCPSQPVDYITKYKITRTVKGKEISSIGHFSYSEAVNADFFTKDSYKKFARIMIGHRAFVFAARDIASDVIMGLMETTELKMTNNKNLSERDFEEVDSDEIIELKTENEVR